MIKLGKDFFILGAARIICWLAVAFFLFGTGLVLWFGFVPEGIEEGTRSFNGTFSDIQNEKGIAATLGVSHLVGRYIWHSILAAAFAALAFFFQQLGALIVNLKRAPFSMKNAKRLRRLAILSFIPIIVAVAERILSSNRVEGGEVLFILILTVLGLTFTVLSSAFRIGVAMREDLEGTV